MKKKVCCSDTAHLSKWGNFHELIYEETELLGCIFFSLPPTLKLPSHKRGNNIECKPALSFKFVILCDSCQPHCLLFARTQQTETTSPPSASKWYYCWRRLLSQRKPGGLPISSYPSNRRQHGRRCIRFQISEKQPSTPF